MIISCINCDKKFNVNSELIPNKGRTIQCGSCGHVWFFDKNNQDNNDFSQPSIQKNKDEKKFVNIDKKSEKFSYKEASKISNNKGFEIIKYQSKNNFTFGKFLSYILIFIISFIALIIILDTFKSPLYVFFPNLESLLFSLFETLKDINLFIKDLF